ncbi:uncharacterized protein [Blastocystis hominis]|uniref:Small ribosomal subunit protein uS10 n=1 Tax=Blastocystis hominis TaxID=12968 RepID=D8M1K0_BLAHO|nr:uncharacterized protein [Blastocystis hominis]CBK21939.2 unnamed protein product [Blastocystis hominis]|eukprot:XP_012895987.1 uncharacterized protein [Blastocystis hominis]
MSMEKEKIVNEDVHRIRITLTSTNVKAVERVCADIKRIATEKQVKVAGPIRLPTKFLRVTTRKSPCGEGTNTWEHLEMRIHKRVIDLIASVEVVKSITTIQIDASVQVEVTVN